MKKVHTNISKHDIRNALTEPDLPLSDQIHGPYRTMPPELLHTYGSGLIVYMFATLTEMVTNKFQNLLDKLYQRISRDATRQSKCNFLRESVRNGIIDGKTCQSTKQRGNIFCLLCITHTTAWKNALLDAWESIGISYIQFCSFIVLYLAMEE